MSMFISYKAFISLMKQKDMIHNIRRGTAGAGGGEQEGPNGG